MSNGRQGDEDELDRRIAEAKRANRLDAPASATAGGENRGMAVGIEFVGAVLLGGFLGWSADKWLGTKPWLLLLFLALGFATGIWRAMQTARQLDASAEAGRKIK